MNFNKIFGIGLSKTGTTSLTKALRMLDYKTIHYPFGLFNHSSPTLDFNFHKMKKYDAATDSPIALFYKELDQAYPGSKFILTTRNLTNWLNSCEKNHIWPGKFLQNNVLAKKKYLRTLLNLHQEVFGTTEFKREAFQKAYQRHYADVLDYFKNRPDDLLIMDLCGGQGWEKLCPFLGKKPLTEPFPILNVGKKKVLKRETRRYLWSFLSTIAPT